MTTETAQISTRDALRSISAKDRRRLTERLDGPGLFRFVGHFGLIICIGCYIGFQAPGWILLLPVQGILLAFGFCPMHECVHNTAFRTTWMNTVLAGFVGFYSFMPAKWFQLFHIDHHHFTNLPGKDPELETPKPTDLKSYIWTLSGIPMWLGRSKTLLRLASGSITEPFIADNQQAMIRLEARIHMLGYGLLLGVSIYFQSALLIWIWLIPILLGQPFLRAFLMTEHTLRPEVPNMLVNSRTTLTNPLVRYISWNMPYHIEHHSYPNVPFHRLAAAHYYLAPHSAEICEGYVNFHRRLIASFKTSPPQSHSPS